MKILMFSWDSFGREDMREAFEELGHQVQEVPLVNGEDDSPEAIASLQVVAEREKPDTVFTFNYYPSVAVVCKNLQIPYISWVYDSPHVRMYHYTIAYPTNRVYVFDKAQYQFFAGQGIQTVYYLPMAANAVRLEKLCREPFRAQGKAPVRSVSFVGSLYTEEHCFYDRLTDISEYTRGYLEGLMAFQRQIWGCNFVEQSLPEAIIKDMQKSLPLQVRPGGVETVEYLFAQYVINRKITADERRDYLEAVSRRFGLNLYTPDRAVSFKKCSNLGTLDYYREAPRVFHDSLINLNISLRSITTGVPLRCFEIMGAGGFLLSNFQEDFLDFFVPGQEFVYYESKEDMLEKIAYYLEHDEERREIARNGYQKVREEHTYRHRAEVMLQDGY